MKSGVDLPFLFIPAKYAFPQKSVDKKTSAGYNEPIPQKGAYENDEPFFYPLLFRHFIRSVFCSSCIVCCQNLI